LYHDLKKPDAPTSDDPFRMGEDVAVYKVKGDPVLALAKLLDAAVRKNAPASWRGILAKENAVERAIFDILQDAAEVERLFPIIKQQPDY
jgi:type I restriction enzyme R subunit